MILTDPEVRLGPRGLPVLWGQMVQMAPLAPADRWDPEVLKSLCYRVGRRVRWVPLGHLGLWVLGALADQGTHFVPVGQRCLETLTPPPVRGALKVRSAPDPQEGQEVQVDPGVRMVPWPQWNQVRPPVDHLCRRSGARDRAL